MPVDAALEIVAEAQRKGDLIGVRMSIADDEEAQDPWALPPSRKRREKPIEGPLLKTVQIVRGNLVYVESKDLPPAMLNRLLRLAAFQNPEFYKAQAMRLSCAPTLVVDLRAVLGRNQTHCLASFSLGHPQGHPPVRVPADADFHGQRGSLVPDDRAESTRRH